VIGANGLPECYLRPIAFYGYGELGVAARGNPVEVVIMSWPWAPYLGTESLKIGIRAKISSWQRVSPNVVPHVSKATGVYLNSMLAVTEANNAGYDEAILLTSEGFVADGSGENIFIVKNGVIYTPDLSASILPGITRDSLIQIAQDLGHRVEELWWWSWGFALVSVGVTAVVLLFAAVGVHDTHPGGPFWWSFGVVDLMLSLSLLYGLFVSSREQPLP
jgi:branched-chain amino acid aminotransferase